MGLNNLFFKNKNLVLNKVSHWFGLNKKKKKLENVSKGKFKFYTVSCLFSEQGEGQTFFYVVSWGVQRVCQKQSLILKTEKVCLLGFTNTSGQSLTSVPQKFVSSNQSAMF